jgi:hypothetical protein
MKDLRFLRAGSVPPPADGQNNGDHFGHWVIALGYAPDGRVIIGDPLSTTGTIKVWSARLTSYFTEWPEKSAAIALF